MNTLKNSLIAAAAVVALQVAGNASAGPVFKFDTSKIPGSTTNYQVTADQITITSTGPAAISVTDNGDGQVTAAFADTYTELGGIGATGFKLGPAILGGGITGLGVGYELYASYSLAGPVGLVGPNIVSPVGVGSATIFYEEVINGLFDPGSAVPLATLVVPPGFGQCSMTALTSFAQGSCKILFDFTAAAGVGGAIWEIGGIDLNGYMYDYMTLDINIDNLVVTTPGITLPSLVPGGVTSILADHDGSAAFHIPEPASLALVGLSLFGLGIARRRRS